MAALLIALGVMSIMMAAAMPVWKQMATREKEAELIFRGEQYVRAIGLFQRRAGPGVTPPSFDVLVDQRFLRKKYKDPITGEDFLPILQGQAVSGAPGASGAGPAGRGQPGMPGAPAGRGQVAPAGRGAVGGIVGVASRSTEQSIRLYNGRDRYNEWQFIFAPQVQTPGAPTPGAAGAPGRRGGPQGPQPAPGIGLPGRGRGPFPAGPPGGPPDGRGRGAFPPQQPPPGN